MELPAEIWNSIVKESKKTNKDIVAEMDLTELQKLENVIAERKSKIYKNMKSKLDRYDVIEVFDKKTNKYISDCVITDKNPKKECCIKVTQLEKGNIKTIFGNYSEGNMFNDNLCLLKYNYKIKSKYSDRCKENIKIANSLKIGDVFSYSQYTGYQWCKKRNVFDVMKTFERGLQYQVVHSMTPDKIIYYRYYKFSDTEVEFIPKYVNKDMILKKIDIDDNEFQFIRNKKMFMYPCIIEIAKISDIKRYFATFRVSYKKHLIQLQKHLEIRP